MSDTNDPVKIGEMLYFSGDLSSLPYSGVYVDLVAGATLQGSEYPEIVSLNPDLATNSREFLPLDSTSNSNYKNYPEAFKKYDAQKGNYWMPNEKNSDKVQGIIFSNSQLPSGDQFNNYYNPFESYRFWNTPNITADDGNGYFSVSSTEAQKHISKFPIHTAKMFDGTVPNDAVVSVVGSKKLNQKFAITVFNMDGYQEDMSDYVNLTNEESYRNDYNSNNDTMFPTMTIMDVWFREDYFVIVEGSEKKLWKFGYDFEGGTLNNRYIWNTEAMDFDLNQGLTSQVWARTICMGNISNEIYQFDASNGNLLKSNNVVGKFNLNSKISNVGNINTRTEQENQNILDNLYETRGLNMWVHEKDDKIFAFLSLNSSYISQQSHECALYFDGTAWKNVTLPYPKNMEQDSSTDSSVIIQKLSLWNGVIVLGQRGATQASPINNITALKDNAVNLISEDYGETWYTELTQDANNSNIESTISNYGLYRRTYSNDRNTFTNDTFGLSESSLFNDSSLVFISDESISNKYYFTETQYIDSCTFKPTNLLNTHMRPYIRVK